jgi:MFS family permease
VDHVPLAKIRATFPRLSGGPPAQLKPIAKDFHLDTTPLTLIGITLPALTFALSVDRVLNGLTRPFFGWVADFFGRENTMFIAFLLEPSWRSSS